MARGNVHSVLVTDGGIEKPLGFVSSLDIITLLNEEVCRPFVLPLQNQVGTTKSEQSLVEASIKRLQNIKCGAALGKLLFLKYN